MYPKPILGIFHLYGIMIAVGILACFGLLTLCGKKFKIEEKFMDFVFFNGFVAIALGFGAAALFQATYNYIENPADGFQFGGITFIGGLIGGIASFLGGYAIFRKRYKSRVTDILSIAPCCILIAHAFGRIGCFFAGCCHGPETDAWYGIYMYAQSFDKYATVVPTHLFEAIFLFALFTVCFLLLWKKNFRYNLSVYLIAYGVFRFCLEYLRADDRGSFIPGLSPSQFWSILMVISGIGLIFLMHWLFKKRDEELALEAEAAAKAKAAQTVQADSENAEKQGEPQENAHPVREIVWREVTETGETAENTQKSETTATEATQTEQTQEAENAEQSATAEATPETAKTPSEPTQNTTENSSTEIEK